MSSSSISRWPSRSKRTKNNAKPVTGPISAGKSSRSLHRARPLLPDLLDSTCHHLSLIDTTGLAEKSGIVIQDFSDLGMVSGQALLPEGQGSLESGLRLGISALLSVDDG